MTLEQLRIFAEVAQRLNMTRAAQALGITQSAVSGAVAALETAHDIKLFHRVGRHIELSDAGTMFLAEAQGVLARAESARAALADWQGLRRGRLALVASQTIAGYWLPERLARFRAAYPQIALDVAIANTDTAARAVLAGTAELGFVEGALDEPALAQWAVGADRMALVGSAPVDHVSNAWLVQASWIMREAGSGTRSTFEAALRARGVDPAGLRPALVLPSNEAVLSAVRAGAGHAVLSGLVVAEAVAAGHLHALPFDMPERPFFALRHKERYRSRAAEALLAVMAAYEAAGDWVI